MAQLSYKFTQESTIKIPSNRFQHPAIAEKVIAFQELVTLKYNNLSARGAARLLEVPNSTMQFWKKQQDNPQNSEGLEAFVNTPEGSAFLQRNTIAVMKLMKTGPSGIRGMQEYLRNSGLDQFVASSEGALQKFWRRCESYIIGFGEREEKRLGPKMRYRKITVGMGEMFKKRRPCLVAIEVVSNYILLEKFTEDRTAETWKKELKEGMADFNIRRFNSEVRHLKRLH